MTTLFAILQALIALPKLVERLESILDGYKQEKINEAIESEKQKLFVMGQNLKAAKSDAEIDAIIHALNNRQL